MQKGLSWTKILRVLFCGFGLPPSQPQSSQLSYIPAVPAAASAQMLLRIYFTADACGCSSREASSHAARLFRPQLSSAMDLPSWWIRTVHVMSTVAKAALLLLGLNVGVEEACA